MSNNDAVTALAKAVVNLQSARDLLTMSEQNVIAVMRAVQGAPAPEAKPEEKTEEPTEEAPKA